MADLTITINSTPYIVACDDGQEEQLRDLAAYISQKVDMVRKSVGNVGETRLLVLASLMVADELSDAYQHIDKLELARQKSLPRDDVDLFINRIEGLAASIESIAAAA
jgi:cell division protein ZapA